MNFRHKLGLAALSLLVSYAVYGRSLPFDFVYDDYVKICDNPSVAYLPSLFDLFTDRELQSSHPRMNVHMYRPLSLLDFAIGYRLWGKNAAGYRFKNLAIHGLNGFLVGLASATLFEMSFVGALAVSLLFLVHPVQVEPVVWVSEISNLTSVFLMLLGSLAWMHFCKRGGQFYAVLTGISFAAALLYRETAVCFFGMLLLIDFLQLSGKDRGPSFLRRWWWYLIFLVMVVVYLSVRQLVLGHFYMTGYWGGTWRTNAAYMFQVWPLYIQTLLIPHPLSINYAPLPVRPILSWATLYGLFLILALIFLLIIFLFRDRRVSFCLSLFLLFWLPTSQIVPLTQIFNERFLYPMMIFLSLLVGLWLDYVVKKTSGGRNIWRWTTSLIFGSYLVTLSVLSLRQLRVWKNDLTLWTHAVEVDPRSWFNWFSLGEAQYRIALSRMNRPWFDLAETSYENALKLGLPKNYAADIFLYLAEVNSYQGKSALANERAKRAILLNPLLEAEWKSLKARP